MQRVHQRDFEAICHRERREAAVIVNDVEVALECFEQPLYAPRPAVE